MKQNKDSCLIGLDVGGTNFRLGLVHQQRVIWELRKQADFAALCRSNSSSDALAYISNTLISAIEEALTQHPQIAAVGIGFPGFVDPVQNRLLASPNLPGLFDVDLSDRLSHVLNIPVIVENDALAATYGEFIMSGIAQNMIYLGLGTGVGGGVIIDSKPYRGSHGLSMEVGHLIIEPGGRLCGCGNRGCLEQYASASGLVLNYAELVPESHHISAMQISALASAGDEMALAAYQRTGDALAQALASMLKVLDVSRVVIGGGMSLSWPLMKPGFERRLDADLMAVLRDKVDISISQSGDQSGIIGAAMLSQIMSDLSV